MKEKVFLFAIVLPLIFIISCAEETVSPQVLKRAKITYGIEIEPDYKNHPRLAYYYRPSSISLEDWTKLEPAQRAELGYSKCNTKTYTVGYDEWFHLVPSGTFPDRVDFVGLPEKMHCDSPGSTEVNGPVFNTLDEFVAFLTSFTEEIGHAGSQGHIVFPREYFPGILGYTLYEGDRALFRRAKEEYDNYLKSRDEMAGVESPNKIPGANFRANALGVMRTENWEYFKKNIERLKNGEKLIFQGTGFGKWSGPHLRETYGDGLLGIEIRQEDNPGTSPRVYMEGQQRLVEAMKRAAYLLEDVDRFKFFVPFESTQILSSKSYQSFLETFRNSATEIANVVGSDALKTEATKVVKESNEELNSTQKKFYWRNWEVIFWKGNYLSPSESGILTPQ